MKIFFVFGFFYSANFVCPQDIVEETSIHQKNKQFFEEIKIKIAILLNKTSNMLILKRINLVNNPINTYNINNYLERVHNRLLNEYKIINQPSSSMSFAIENNIKHFQKTEKQLEYMLFVLNDKENSVLPSEVFDNLN